MKYILVIFVGILLSLCSTTRAVEKQNVVISKDTIDPSLVDTIYSKTVTIICYYEYTRMTDPETWEYVLVETYQCDTIYEK